ncbi:MAG TPA: pilin [Candidatus Magasanikbacteria bacterium]|nr:pilin [Candidatus Magasanikbacteria bacterium]
MQFLKKLAKNKVVMAVMFTLVMGMFFAPVANAQVNFGLSYATETGLGNRDIRATVASIIKVAMGLLGIVAVVIILIGGFEWMTAGGSDDKVGEAKKRILYGVIGLAIIMSAYALTTFVLTQLYTATSTTGTADYYTEVGDIEPNQ